MPVCLCEIDPGHFLTAHAKSVNLPCTSVNVVRLQIAMIPGTHYLIPVHIPQSGGV